MPKHIYAIRKREFCSCRVLSLTDCMGFPSPQLPQLIKYLPAACSKFPPTQSRLLPNVSRGCNFVVVCVNVYVLKGGQEIIKRKKQMIPVTSRCHEKISCNLFKCTKLMFILWNWVLNNLLMIWYLVCGLPTFVTFFIPFSPLGIPSYMLCFWVTPLPLVLKNSLYLKPALTENST